MAKLEAALKTLFILLKRITIGAAGAFKTIVLVYFYIGFYIRNKNVPGVQYVEVLIPNLLPIRQPLRLLSQRWTHPTTKIAQKYPQPWRSLALPRSPPGQSYANPKVLYAP